MTDRVQLAPLADSSKSVTWGLLLSPNSGLPLLADGPNTLTIWPVTGEDCAFQLTPFQ